MESKIIIGLLILAVCIYYFINNYKENKDREELENWLAKENSKFETGLVPFNKRKR